MGSDTGGGGGVTPTILNFNVYSLFCHWLGQLCGREDIYKVLGVHTDQKVIMFYENNKWLLVGYGKFIHDILIICCGAFSGLNCR